MPNKGVHSYIAMFKFDSNKSRPISNVHYATDMALLPGKPMAVFQVRGSGKAGYYSCKRCSTLHRNETSQNQYSILLKSANYIL